MNDIDEKLARKAIRTVGKIALEVNCAARRAHGTTLHMPCLQHFELIWWDATLWKRSYYSFTAVLAVLLLDLSLGCQCPE